jgi:hypothetical protein
VKPGTSVVWDRRFRVTAGPAAPAGLSVSALGEDGRREIGIGRGLAPPGALAALAALRRRGRLVTVPALGYSVSKTNKLDVEIVPTLEGRLSRPPLFPDFSAGL